MHSHHSHSGSYISHGSDDLESVVLRAKKMGFTHFCLTEHMPRLAHEFLYPEELEKNYTVEDLEANFEKYLEHAKKIQRRFNEEAQMKILIGFEIEGLDDLHSKYAYEYISGQKFAGINMSIGSVHYVRNIAIDFSPELWKKARDCTQEGTSRGLYKEYFDLQYQILRSLKPQIIGHFDLIRLFAPTEELDPTTGKKIGEIDIRTDWPDVWEAILRNIEFVNSYGGIFELNSSAIRKGWDTPYPRKDACSAIIEANGKFCLSDDSHCIAQVGLNYGKVLNYIVEDLKLEKIHYLDLDNDGNTLVKDMSVEKLAASKFWDQFK